MKKRFLTLLLSATMLFSAVGFTACTNGELEAKIAELQAQISTQQTQILEQQEQIKALEQEKQELEEEIEYLQSNINAKTGLENGFKPCDGEDETPIFYCAYRSDKTEFDIDNVTLDFYYGGYYYQGAEFELENAHDFPSFELYFEEDNGNNFFVKRVEENFVSDKYSCEVVYDENWHITEIRYNHSEQITIPSEVFTKENGQIWFEIHSANANDIESEVKCITGISIFYQVSNGRVILSNQELK
ncbi:MAG: hypothetical protein E7370_03845 [Clostridiales bacterium]|nr:hypothetical protein [Clostridiales bacterium]